MRSAPPVSPGRATRIGATAHWAFLHPTPPAVSRRIGAVRKIIVRADASNFSAYSPRPAVAARSRPDTTGQNTKPLPTAFAQVEP